MLWAACLELVILCYMHVSPQFEHMEQKPLYGHSTLMTGQSAAGGWSWPLKPTHHTEHLPSITSFIVLPLLEEVLHGLLGLDLWVNS